MGFRQGSHLVAGHAKVRWLATQKVFVGGWMGLMAGKAGVRGGGVGVRKAKSGFDISMAGEAKILGFLFQESFASTIVGSVAGPALALSFKAVVHQLVFDRIEFFVADAAERPPATRVENIGIGGSMVFMAPLALPLPQRLMGRLGIAKLRRRGMTLHAGLAGSGHGRRRKSPGENRREKEGCLGQHPAGGSHDFQDRLRAEKERV